jgi:hypothetical protein
MRDLLSRQGLCHPATCELQFFNHECFAGRAIREDERDAYFAEWHTTAGPTRRAAFEAFRIRQVARHVCAAVDPAACMPGAAASAEDSTDAPRSGFASLQRLPPVPQRGPVSATEAPSSPQLTARTQSATASASPQRWRWRSPIAAHPGVRAILSEMPNSARPTRSVACGLRAAQHGFQSPNAWPLCKNTPR